MGCNLQSSAFWLSWSPFWYHRYLLPFDFADLWRRDLRFPIPVSRSGLPQHHHAANHLGLDFPLVLANFSSPPRPSLATRQPHQFAESPDHHHGLIPHVGLHQLVSFSIHQSASPWGIFRGGLGSMPACPPRTPCTFYGRAYGISLSHNRASTHHVPAGTRLGSTGDLQLSAARFLVGMVLSSTCPCHDHTLLCCGRQTRRSVHLHDLPSHVLPARRHFSIVRPWIVNSVSADGWIFLDGAIIAIVVALTIPIAATLLNVSLGFSESSFNSTLTY